METCVLGCKTRTMVFRIKSTGIIETAKSKIKKFDDNIKNISFVSYRRLNDDKFIRLIRKGNYSMVPLAKIMYRIWVMKYGY